MFVYNCKFIKIIPHFMSNQLVFKRFTNLFFSLYQKLHKVNSPDIYRCAVLMLTMDRISPKTRSDCTVAPRSQSTFKGIFFAENEGNVGCNEVGSMLEMFRMAYPNYSLEVRAFLVLAGYYRRFISTLTK